MTLILNERESAVFKDGEKLHLTPYECQILSYLMAHPEETLSAESIYEHVWEEEPFDCHLIISVHMRHLREKIERNPSKPDYIRMKRGKGYCWFNDEETS